MKKYMVSIMTALFLSMVLLMPVSAEKNRVIDDADLLTTEEEAQLAAQLNEISERQQADVVVVTQDDLGGKTTQQYADDYYDNNGYGYGDTYDGVLLLLDLENSQWYMTTCGTMAQIIPEGDIYRIGEAMNEGLGENDVYKAFTTYATLVDQQITEKRGGTPEPVVTEEDTTDVVTVEATRVVDGADLLTDQEEADLLAQLDEISERQQVDVSVVTQNEIGDKTPMEYADDYFDYNGYGIGENRDGVLLLVSMADRDWWMSTHGYGITAFTDAGIEYIGEQFLSYLSDGYYFKAFSTYAEQCDLFITQAKTGEPYDVGNLPKGSVHPVYIPISILVGCLLSYLLALRKKAALKSVRTNEYAAAYAVPGSMMLSIRSDQFVRKYVSSRVIETKSSSGGSSTHTSSSGSTHGGGGGKF